MTDPAAQPLQLPPPTIYPAAPATGVRPLPQSSSLPPPRLDIRRKADRNAAPLEATGTSRDGIAARYRPGAATTLGIEAEAHQAAVPEHLVQQDSQVLGAYLGYRPSPMLNVEAAAKWGRSSGAVAGQSIEGQHSEVSARINGSVAVGRLKVSPSITVRHGIEQAPGTTAAPPAENSAMVIEPKVSRPVRLDDGRTLEPYLTFRDEIDLSPAAPGTKSQTRSARAGITLDRTDGYSLSLSTGLDDLDTTERNMTSRLRLQVPLK